MERRKGARPSPGYQESIGHQLSFGVSPLTTRRPQMVHKLAPNSPIVAQVSHTTRTSSTLSLVKEIVGNGLGIELQHGRRLCACQKQKQTSRRTRNRRKTIRSKNKKRRESSPAGGPKTGPRGIVILAHRHQVDSAEKKCG
jgi:hypothetical protein